MEDIFSLFDEPREVFFKTKLINEKDFAKELAFHEASHFVIQRLLHPFDLGFLESDNLWINTKERRGNVHGFMIQDFNHTVWTEPVYRKFRKFFNTDYRRYKGYCLELIAGYASYKIFIEDSDFFISFGDFINNRNELKMYKLETVPHSIRRTENDRKLFGVSDFAKIKEQISFQGIGNEKERLELYHQFLSDITDIMNINAVELAIRYVKNRLLRMDGKIIEGEYFNHIKYFVDDLVKRVCIEEYLIS